MDSHMTAQAIGRQSIWQPFSGLIPLLLLALVAAPAVVSVVLFQRRLAGVLINPGGAALLVAGLWAVALAAAPRTLARVLRQPLGPAWLTGVVWLVPALALVLAVLALTVSGSPWWARAAVWAAAIAEEAWFWSPALRNGAIRGRFVPGSFPRKGFRLPSLLRWNPRAADSTPRRSKPVPSREPTEQIAALRTATEQPEAHVWQHISRAYEAEGADVLRGTLRAFLAAGQRTAHVHLAFCPPFARLPQFDFRQSDGPSAHVKLGQLLPYGVRLDVKLDTPADAPATVLLQLTAREEQVSTTAPCSS